MDSSRTVRFGALIASFLAFALVTAAWARAAGTASIYASDASGWHNAADPSSPNAAIDVGGTVTWENRDTNSPHPVECVQQDSNATCPWSGAKDLPQKSALGPPTTASVTFTKPGTYAFRCAIHITTMRGTILVGSGHPAPTSTPTSSSRPTGAARASVQPTVRAPASSSASLAPSTRATRGPSARTSVLAVGPSAAARTEALGKTSSQSTTGLALPAAALIALVAGGHVARARRRGA
ncbi:MAG: cupredoxin domain-containing protein [Actinomycetota bacterium]